MNKSTLKYNGATYKREVTARRVRHWYIKNNKGKWIYLHDPQLCSKLDALKGGW